MAGEVVERAAGRHDVDEAEQRGLQLAVLRRELHRLLVGALERVARRRRHRRREPLADGEQLLLERTLLHHGVTIPWPHEDRRGRRRAHGRRRRRRRASCARRGHEPLAARRALRRRARRLGVGLRGRRARRRRGPRRAGASSAAGPAPAPRSPPTRSAASAPRSAPTPPPPRARGRWNDANVLALSLRTTSRGACCGDPRRVVRRASRRADGDDRANIAHLDEIEGSWAGRCEAHDAVRLDLVARWPSSSSRSTWPSTSRERQVGLRDGDVAPQRLGDLVGRARPLGDQAARSCSARRRVQARSARRSARTWSVDRLAVAGQHERRAPSRASRAATHVGDQRLRARPRRRLAAERARDQRVGGDVRDQVVGRRAASRARSSWKTRVRGASGRAGAAPRSVRSRELELARRRRSGRVDLAVEPQARKRARDRAQRGDDVRAGCRGAASAARRSSSSRSACLAEARRARARAGRAPRPRRPSAARGSSTSPKWSMCWWVMTMQLEVLDAWPCVGQRALELVERLARVRARSRRASAARPRSGSS